MNGGNLLVGNKLQYDHINSHNKSNEHLLSTCLLPGTALSHLSQQQQLKASESIFQTRKLRLRSHGGSKSHNCQFQKEGWIPGQSESQVSGPTI